jgi:hypothetical protein
MMCIPDHLPPHPPPNLYVFEQVPTQLFVLQRLPTTASGKVLKTGGDRAAINKQVGRQLAYSGSNYKAHTHTCRCRKALFPDGGWMPVID